jgi:phage shock protein PspC (stress-responsive transcriptional regulator)
MNKTVNINIGGLFFHIDEDAYQKLSRYFDAIKRSLNNASGKDEIMKDIEMRVAELFTDRQKSDKHVINNKDVDEVVTIMGQPEDYRIDDDSTETENFTSTSFTGRKKLYRDRNRATIGGVCTGLGHYFGIDAVWIKIIFILFTWVGGSGILAYLILWIATPEAITTSEKLEMTGEPVTISNIEKKVREEFETVSSKIKNVDYDKVGNQIRSTTVNAGNRAGSILGTVFGAFAKIIGAFIVMLSSIMLLGICIASVILLFSSSLPNQYVFNHIHTALDFVTPLWIQGLLFFFVFGIPMFFLLILGLKLLVNNMRSIGAIVKYCLLAVWVIAIGILITILINETSRNAFDGKISNKQTITLNPTDTLSIKFKFNDYYSKNINDRKDFYLTQDDKNQQVVYSNNVHFEIIRTDEKVAYIQVEKLAQGNSNADAKNKAEKIAYNYSINGNQIVLDNYFLNHDISKSRYQRVEIYLYLPKGTLLKPDASVRDFDDSDDDYFNLHYSSDNYTYKVGDSKIKCLNCPANEDEHDDVDNNDNNDYENHSDSNLIEENGKIINKSTTVTNDPGQTTTKKEVIINSAGATVKETKVSNSKTK